MLFCLVFSKQIWIWIMFKLVSNQIVHKIKVATNIEYWFRLNSNCLAVLGSKTLFTLWKWFQIWSTKVVSERPHSCGHFDTKIKVVSIFSNGVNPMWTRVSGQPLKDLNTMTMVQTGSPRSLLQSNYAGLY